MVTGFFAGCARRAMIVERFQYSEEKHVWHVRIFHVLRNFHVNAAGARAWLVIEYLRIFHVNAAGTSAWLVIECQQNFHRASAPAAGGRRGSRTR